MALPLGSTVALSPVRRLMSDFLYFSRHVPLITMERQIDLAEVVEARARLEQRPSWFALFLKAYAIVSEQQPILRRSYLPFPWPRLHQHACNVAALAIARKVGDEDGVLFLRIAHPEQRSLIELDELIRRARTEPLEQFADFRRYLRLGRWPLPLRRLMWWAGLEVSGRCREKNFGTFGVSGVAALGASLVNLLSPLTTTISYGPFADNGTAIARLFYDHRVLDGVEPARALEMLEETLRGPILQELRSFALTRRAA